jgi:hypothetical protein
VQLGAFSRWHLEFVERLVEVVHEGVPFLRRYVEMAVGVAMVRPVYFCGPPLARKPFRWRSHPGGKDQNQTR